MNGGRGPRRAVAPLLVAVSLAGFLAVALLRDPGLSGLRRWPRPMAEPERTAALQALGRYQRILADFFASGGMAALIDEFPATKAVRHRVFKEIGFLRDRGLVQVIDLADAIPISAEQTGDDTAEVVLYEEWNWTLQRASDRGQVAPVKGLGQGFRYGLRREGEVWVVTGWRPEDARRPAAPPEFKY